MRDWKSSLKATAIGAASGTAMGLLAFAFLSSRQAPGMGEVLFLLVPVVAGFSIEMVTRGFNSAAAAALLSVLCSLVMLIAMGKEGVLCAVLAFPIILAGLGIGIGLGALVVKLWLKNGANKGTTVGALILVGPMLIVAGERIETPMLRNTRTEIIQSSVKVNDSPDGVWSHILSIDNIRASKPMLMYVGLPIPERCTLQGTGVGAKRTCYFDTGYIEETISAWNPPFLMGLTIDRTHMPGRHWLGFESAEYRIEPHGQTTTLRRSTTISSHLRPSWYWSRFERMGVESEHRYILQDVVLRSAH